MSSQLPFFRRAADEALDDETARQIAEQRRAIEQNPDWAEGYYHLAQLLRVQHKRDEAKRHLLIALEMQPALADAHVALGEIYIAEGDLDRARVHAEFAAACGNPRLLEQMTRHNAK
ncbi:MAG: tetratricopeptide repeat protein [Acidobacteriia bacterium]|nr:tetratricopeptide repeat protein [Terriglobia bacterium]